MFSVGELAHYEENGYVIVRGLFKSQEITTLREYSQKSQELKDNTFSRGDGEGGSVDLALWNQADDSIFGRFPRSERLVNRMEELLGEEVYHYHSKMVQKNPKTGGAWAWHQDYGYWYQNGLLYADKVASIMIAVDKATKENGCLQVISGSHKLHRLEHVLTGDQAGADTEAVDAVLKRLPIVHIELDMGDAVFFHSNLLHRSDQNTSERPRWAMISCYNAKSNSPYKKSHHPAYSPLIKVSDDDILNGSNVESVDWLKNEDDTSAKILKVK